MKKIMVVLPLLVAAACGAVPTPIPTSTFVPTNTALPPTATVTFTPVPDGPCDNPLVPLTTGNQWKYLTRTNSGDFPYEMRAVERRDDRNIVILIDFTDVKRGQTVHEPVVCRDGAIDNYPLFVLDMLLADYLDKLFNTYHVKEDYAPAYAAFIENDWIMSWGSEYLTEDTVGIKNPIGGNDIIVGRNIPIRQSFDMDGSTRSLSVPAGDFPNTLTVRHRVDLSVTITLDTGGTAGILTITSTQWYEPYVGLIRAELNTTSIEVVGKVISIPISSRVELTEFKQGQ